MMNVTKRCSKCRKYQSDDNYGLKKNGSEYRTCVTCRKKQPPVSSTTLLASSTSSSSRPTNCLPGCINPNDGLHHKRCPNYIPPTHVEDNLVWKKGFLNTANKDIAKAPLVRPNTCTFSEICDTLKHYGIQVYTKNDIYIKTCSYLDFVPIIAKLKQTKSVFIYELSYPSKMAETEFCMEVLEARFKGTMSEPKLIITMFDGSDNLISTFIPYINIYKDFVYVEKLKNHRRCNICKSKTKCFRICSRCNDKYCKDCFTNYNTDRMKPCPYCKYSFTEHCDSMLRSMVSKNEIK